MVRTVQMKKTFSIVTAILALSLAMALALFPVVAAAQTEEDEAQSDEALELQAIAFQLTPEKSVLRAEAGYQAGPGQVLSWHPDLDEAFVARGYDYIVDGTIYRWTGEPGAVVWYNDSGRLSIDVIVPDGTAGTLRLFMWDWTHEGRHQVVEIEGQPIQEVDEFSDGLWLDVPITSQDTQDGLVSVVIRRIAGPNPVLQALEFVPAPMDVEAGLNAPIGQVLEWSPEYDLVHRLDEGYGYTVGGTIYRWDEATSVWYDDSGLLEMKVNVPQGVTGILALLLEAPGRDQSISVDGAVVGRFSQFDAGEWVLVPVTKAMTEDGLLLVEVELHSGANPVVNRMQFIPGLPPASDAPTDLFIWAGANAEPTAEPIPWSPELDDAELPIGYTYQVLLGDVWKAEDGRSAWVEPDTIQVLLQMSPGQSGSLWLVMEDFDGAGRVQTVQVQGRRLATVESFEDGLWLAVPIKEEHTAAGVIGIVIRAVDGPDATLSQIWFFPDDAGADETGDE